MISHAYIVSFELRLVAFYETRVVHTRSLLSYYLQPPRSIPSSSCSTAAGAYPANVSLLNFSASLCETLIVRPSPVTLLTLLIVVFVVLFVVFVVVVVGRIVVCDDTRAAGAGGACARVSV